MPIINGSGSFSVGRDCQVVVSHPLAPGGRVDLPNVMGFDCKQETTNVKVDRLDGIQMNAELPKGWTGSFDVERGSAAVDSLFALIEASWIIGGVYSVGIVHQYITESNGSQTCWQFDNVSLKYDDAGSWKGDASVKQKLSFTANRRRQV